MKHYIFSSVLKKTTVVILATFMTLISLSYPGSSQSWKEKFNNKKVNVLELEKEFHEYWSELDLENVGTEYKQYARRLHRMKRRMDSKGYLQESVHVRELVNLHRNNEAVKRQQSTMLEPWVFIGPDKSPAASSISFGQGVGRITTIAWHPENANRIIAGAHTGGIWISDNMGESWYKSNDDLFTHLAISHIIYSPNPDILYAGTGGHQLKSYGLLKSIDGGNNWNLTNFTFNGSVYFNKINDIIVHPENEDDVIVSTNSGTFQSFDGGVSWSSLTDLSFLDMHYSKNQQRVYGVSTMEDNPGFYYYDLSNLTWHKTFNLQSNFTESRIGISQADTDLVYVWEEHRNDAGNLINKFYKSNDEGDNFDYVSTIPNYKLYSSGYDFRSMVVDPLDSDVIFLGAVSMVRSTDGGLTWVGRTCDDDECVHFDHWDAQFFNNNLFLATDGGIWSSSDYGENWSSHNSGLEVTQYYRIATSESDPYISLAGSQDNGSMIYNNGWTFIGGGDGMDNAIDPYDPNIFYYSYQNGRFSYSYDGGESTQTSINKSITGIDGSWVTPLVLDKQSPNILYAGYDRVWKSTDRGQSWTDFNNPSLCTSNYSCIEYLDISQSNPNVIYAATGLNIFRSTDAGQTWVKRNVESVFGNWLEIDPKNEDRLWMTRYGSIMESIDGGISWLDIKADLPDNIEYTAIVCDENTNDHLYVGTLAAGLYFKDASMTNWLPYDLNLPKVEISDLEIVENYKILRAGTYGRGMWQTYTMDYRYCDDTLNISDIIEDGVHQANIIVQSDGTANAGTSFKFTAKENIQLLPNFEINKTARFEAMIDSCVTLIPPILPEGYVCDRALPILDNGTIDSPGPKYGNGNYLHNYHSVWYAYTAVSDGKLFVNSCGFKTRLTLWRGSCAANNPDLEFQLRSGYVENGCGDENTFEDGSKIEDFQLFAGEKILLEWDNSFSLLPFQFSFRFDPM